MTSYRVFDPVACADIARRLGVTRAAVSNYRARSTSKGRPFPEPVFEVANGTVPVFEWADVRAWAEERRTGIDGRYGPEVVVAD